MSSILGTVIAVNYEFTIVDIATGRSAGICTVILRHSTRCLAHNNLKARCSITNRRYGETTDNGIGITLTVVKSPLWTWNTAKHFARCLPNRTQRLPSTWRTAVKTRLLLIPFGGSALGLPRAHQKTQHYPNAEHHCTRHSNLTLFCI